jgi:hypothetical protein
MMFESYSHFSSYVSSNNVCSNDVCFNDVCSYDYCSNNICSNDVCYNYVRPTNVCSKMLGLIMFVLHNSI